jgi:hypothetical protein
VLENALLPALRLCCEKPRVRFYGYPSAGTAMSKQVSTRFPAGRASASSKQMREDNRVKDTQRQRNRHDSRFDRASQRLERQVDAHKF